MKNKIITALVSVAIAFGLWLYVVTVVSPGYENTYYDIPVVIQNESLLEERGLMIVKNNTPTVTLHLVGNRIDLNKLNRSNITVTVDASRIAEPGQQNISYNIVYPDLIADDSISAQKSPGSITLVVEERISKTVDVVVEYTGQLEDAFSIDKDNAVKSVEVINVTGPKSVVDKIKQAKIFVDLEGRKQSISQDFAYTLCDENGQKIESDKIITDVETVNLAVKIQMQKTVRLELDFRAGGGLSKDIITYQQAVGTITVAGSENDLKDLEVIVLDPIYLEKMQTQVTLPITAKLPMNVVCVSGETEETVTITYPEMKEQTLVLTKFTAENTGGKKVEWVTTKLSVIIRYPASKRYTITADDIKVTVNFADEQEGKNIVKNAKISIDKYADVGAVGTYPITANLG